MIQSLLRDLRTVNETIRDQKSILKVFGERETARVSFRDAMVLGPRRYNPDRYPKRPLLSTALELLPELGASMTSWKNLAAASCRKGRGRNANDRLEVARLVGLALAAQGIPLAASADGKFARVLTVVYEAAGFSVPQDQFWDIHRVLNDPTSGIPPAALLKKSRVIG
jgi:hypothetical protein